MAEVAAKAEPVKKRGIDSRKLQLRCKDMKKYEDIDDKFYEFVKKHIVDNPKSLLLKKGIAEDGDATRFAIVQIECRQKTKSKLEEILQEERFLFPCLQAAEQASHQSVAAYHARLAGSGQKIIDLTGGLGIDSFAMACAGNEVTTIELDGERAAALRHNSRLLAPDHMEIIEGDSMAYLGAHPEAHFDIAFVDPARRDDTGRRAYFFKDCVPNIIANYSLISRCADRLLVKGSPIIEPKKVMEELPGVEEIHIVSVKNECKEVLTICNLQRDARATEVEAECVLTAVDLSNDSHAPELSRYSLRVSQLGQSDAPIAERCDIHPGAYLYDPNAALHKIRCATKLCADFNGLKRLSANTDLYISDNLHPDFPGRRFRIESIPDKKECKAMTGSRCDVATRNYPLSAEQLRKKMKLHSDTESYIFGCRLGKKEEALLIKCRKDC